MVRLADLFLLPLGAQQCSYSLGQSNSPVRLEHQQRPGKEIHRAPYLIILYSPRFAAC